MAHTPSQGPYVSETLEDMIARAYLTCVREVRNHGRDAASRGCLARVDQDQQLHEVVVHFAAPTLDDVHVLLANRLVDGDATTQTAGEKHEHRGHRQAEPDLTR